MSSPSPRPVASRRARPVFQGPTYMAPQYHSRIWGRLVFITFILLLGLIITVGGGLYWGLHRAQGSAVAPVSFRVTTGDDAATIANRLARAGMINSTLLFRLDARIRGLGGSLKVGDYTLRRNMSIDDMVAALQKYSAPTITLTVPEGWRAEQIAQRLQREGVNARQFMAIVDNPRPYLPYLNAGILQGLPRNATLEGFLFPDTYNIQPDLGAKGVIRQMVQQMDAKFTPRMRAAARRRGWSPYQVLTLASIVEREARIANDRPKIASVYVNRLNQHPPMSLGADPTVQYAIGTAKNWWPVLQQTGGTVDPASRYNTYTHYGLPPGPIANPGLPSIWAAVYPAQTNFLYFLAIPNGHGRTVFAATYADQLTNQQKYGL